MYHSVHGIQFNRACDTRLSMGNYLPAYTNGNYATCVDADGYDFGRNVSSDLACCLQAVIISTDEYATTCPDELKERCEEEGIVKCADYSKLIRDHYVIRV